MKAWVRIALKLLTGYLVKDGKTEQASMITDALAAIKAGREVDDIMDTAADKWETEGEPSIAEIAEARQEIQARIGASVGDGGG
jgi:hypothetical protein